MLSIQSLLGLFLCCLLPNTWFLGAIWRIDILLEPNTLSGPHVTPSTKGIMMNHLSTRLLLLATPGLLATSALASYSPDWQQYQLMGEASRQLGDRLTEVTFELSARSGDAPYQQLRVYRRFDWRDANLVRWQSSSAASRNSRSSRAGRSATSAVKRWYRPARPSRPAAMTMVTA